MRHSTAISRVLALKGILTDLDGNGTADCDRHGNALGDGGGMTPEDLSEGQAYVVVNGVYLVHPITGTYVITEI